VEIGDRGRKRYTKIVQHPTQLCRDRGRRREEIYKNCSAPLHSYAPYCLHWKEDGGGETGIEIQTMLSTLMPLILCLYLEGGQGKEKLISLALIN